MSMPPPPPGAPPPPPPGSGEPSSGGQPPYVGGPPGYPPASPPPPPTPPGYVPFGVQGGGMPQGQRTNGLAVASLVLGIVGILLCFLFIPWILAIVFGAIGIKQCNADPTYSGKGLAIAGLVCGLVGLGLMVLVFATGDTNFEFGLLSPTR